MEIVLQYINIFLEQKLSKSIMYYNHQIYPSVTSPLVYYYYPTPLFYYHSQNIPLTPFNNAQNTQLTISKQSEKINPFTDFGKSDEIIKEKGETCQSLSQMQIKQKSNKKTERVKSKVNCSIPAMKSKEVRLSYRIEWRNENRNIVPNLINQMISFLLKQSKSMKLANRLFSYLPHPQQFTLPKYFQYVKKIKQSVTHYVNQSVFLHFFEIHQPNCQLYTIQEQQFYMKVCRIVILSFLRNEIKLISLTSKRMSESKRKIHLIARQALENKFLQLCRASSK